VFFAKNGLAYFVVTSTAEIGSFVLKSRDRTMIFQGQIKNSYINNFFANYSELNI
jgi:hypothetical protein